MMAAVDANGAFTLDVLVAAAGRTFLWIGFITQLLCNLLLMSCTKLFDVWIGWVSLRGGEGDIPNYLKICNAIKYKRWIGTDVLCWTMISKRDPGVLLDGLPLPPKRACTLAWGQWVSRSDTCWTNYFSLPWNGHQFMWLSQVWDPQVSKDGENGKQSPTSSYIPFPCNKTFWRSLWERSHPSWFLSCIARTCLCPTKDISWCCWLPPNGVSSGAG